MPTPIVMRAPRPGKDWKPALVFGANKLRAEWPFLDLFHVFQTELAASNRLIVVGYSFQDEHVNQCLSQWLNRDKRRQVTIVDPGFESSTAPYVVDLKRVVPGRIRLLSRSAKDALSEALQ